MQARRLFIYNVRSAHNVGAMFRTADGAGVEHVYIAGYTPAPLDRFGRIPAPVAKTSLGAIYSVPWSAVSETESAATLRQLQNEGYRVVALEQTPDSMSLYEWSVPEQWVLVVGSEVDGVPAEILAIADTTVEIPMHGHKESLNVATATGITLFHHPL